MRAIATLGVIGFVLLGTAAAGASSAGPVSWGKPNVSYDQYRADSEDCALEGLTAALQQQAPALEPAGAKDTLDDFVRHSGSQQLQRRHVEITQGQSALDRCLVSRGYRQFRLTDEQRAHLQTLAVQERHEYLYSLADDAAVLAAQGL